MATPWNPPARSTRQVLGSGVLLVSAVALAVPLSGQRPQPATLVLRHGNIATVDQRAPRAEAIAVRNDTIVAVGRNDEIQAYVGPGTRVLDLQGRFAMPGFIDGHAHFMAVGAARLTLDLSKAKNWDEVVALVKARAAHATSGEWILGRGWHQEKWDRRPEPDVECFPTHASLSAVTPDTPVLLTHASGHAVFANGKAIQFAGIRDVSTNPDGGEIQRGPDGLPTGLFRDNAADLLWRAYESWRSTLRPAEREVEYRQQIQLANEAFLSKGVTSVQDAGVGFPVVDRYKRSIDEGALGVRLWVMLQGTPDELDSRLKTSRVVGYGSNHLTVRAIKIVLDGALGSRSAWLLQPYSDAPLSRGLQVVSLDALNATARLALREQFQLAVHAIGDRANREALDAFERAFAGDGHGRALRWRIEHAQHLDRTDIPRFARLGVIASMQGIHATSDAPYVLSRLGATRAQEGAYVWQTLIASGATVSNGTDAPVEDPDPIPNFYASVTRRLPDGSSFFPGERMSRTQALESMTIAAAYAAFEEDIKGSLAPGKLADIVILDRDITTVAEPDIRAATVLTTIVGGTVVYESKGLARNPAP